jgi:SAM-dependent methyltransferase
MNDAPGAYHTVHLTENPAREIVWGVVADHLSPFVPPSARVLEIGAGHCCWINAVRAERRVAVDLWPGVAQHAGPGVEARVLDVASGLPALGRGQFDTVLASNVLEHFSPDTASSIAADVASLLAPGGRLIVIQPNFRYAYRHYFDDYTHRSIFTDVSLPNLLRSHGFTIEALRPKFLPYSMRETRLPISPWLIRAYLRSPLKPFAGQMLVVARRS